MRLTCLTLELAAAALLGLGSAAAAADVKTGVDHWMKRDYAQAVAEWRPLAEKGNADAQFNLGQAYKLGRGVPADLRIAQSWYEKAAQAGHAEAQANLGLILYQGGRKTAAMPWIKRAADRGDPRAQYVYGTELFNGDVVAKDWPRSYAMMTRASAAGLPQAADSLAQMEQHLSAIDKQKAAGLARGLEAAGQARRAPQPVAAPPTSSAKPGRVAGAALVSKAPAKAVPTAAAAAPKPMPAAAPTAGGGWRVQLGAYGSEAAARTQWAGIAERVGAFAALSPTYEKAGAFTRLRVGPAAGKAAADGLCAAARAAGQACFPVPPGR